MKRKHDYIDCVYAENGIDCCNGVEEGTPCLLLFDELCEVYEPWDILNRDILELYPKGHKPPKPEFIKCDLENKRDYLGQPYNCLLHNSSDCHMCTLSKNYKFN